MVKLTRIYTRGGDQGQTSLGSGQRVPKTHPRVLAYSAVEEANAAIGMARCETTGDADAMLARIQNDLFDLGADLCTPGAEDSSAVLRIQGQQVDRLEREIDTLNATLEPLESFVLPGGNDAAARLHFARTVARRAECAIVALAENDSVNPVAIKFINRLSDHLFVLSRHINDGGDVLWKPGANR